MKARLMTLLDKLRGGAWPSPVRAVRCPVKSGNERDLYIQLLTTFWIEHIVWTAFERRRKVQATVGLYAPNPPGYTRAAMAETMGSDPEKGRQSRNSASVWIEGWNPPS